MKNKLYFAANVSIYIFAKKCIQAHTLILTENRRKTTDASITSMQPYLKTSNKFQCLNLYYVPVSIEGKAKTELTWQHEDLAMTIIQSLLSYISKILVICRLQNFYCFVTKIFKNLSTHLHRLKMFFFNILKNLIPKSGRLFT